MTSPPRHGGPGHWIEQRDGYATARTLAADGAAVASVARRRDLDELASAIRSDGGGVLVLQADVTDKGHVGNAVERAVSELGRLDTVVNNAGIVLLGRAADAPMEEWDQMVALNVQGRVVCHPCGPPAPCAGRSGRAAPCRGSGQYQLHRRTRGTTGQQRLQPHQVRHHRPRESLRQSLFQANPVDPH
jgi:NAD(P)-dependent dehydrogenase (short-subunit alcohol dehydrogenase family)